MLVALAGDYKTLEKQRSSFTHNIQLSQVRPMTRA